MRKTSKILLLALAAVLAFSLAGCQRPVKEIKLDTSAVKTELAFNEELDLSGLIVTAVYEDGTEAAVSASDYTVDEGGFQKDQAGTYTITVTAHEKQASFQVTVAEFVRLETGFRVDRSSVLEVYGYGSDVDFSGVKVYALFNDETEELLEETEYDLDDSGFLNDEVGTYDITVTYKDYPAVTFKVQIVEAGEENSQIFDGDTRIMFSTVNYTFSVSSDQTVRFIAENGAVTEVVCKAGETYAYPKLENGDYEMKYVSSSGEQTTRKIRFVDRVSSLGYGTDYELYLGVLENLGQEGSDFLTTEADPYEVGTADGFLLDVELLGDGAAAIDFSLDVLNLTFELKENDAFVGVPADLAVLEGNEVRFDPAYAGRTVRVTVESRYTDQAVLTFEFLLNDGVNVFTHKEMEAAYGSFNVQCINLHRNLIITADDLDDDQFFWVDGEKCCIKNMTESSVANTIEYDAQGNLVNNASGNLYVRLSYDMTGDHLTVNGNYFTIDTTALDPFKPHTDSNHPGNVGTLNNTGENRPVVNSQTGVFWSSVRTNTSDRNALIAAAEAAVDDSGDTLIDGSKAVMDQGEDNWQVINNLSIKGNSRRPTEDQIGQEGELDVIYANSGAYCGFRYYYNDMVFNSVSIYATVIPISAVGLGCDTEIDSCYLRESWANNVYSWDGSDVVIRDSLLTTAGGASIWLEDQDYRAGSVFATNLSIENSTIENLVAGTEPWFVAWNLTFVTTALAQIEGGISQFTQGAKTVIQEKTTNGLTSECFNFGIVTIEKYDTPPEGEGRFMSSFSLDGVYSQRNRETFKTDLRTSNNVPIYSYTDQFYDSAAFNGLVQAALPAVGNDPTMAFNYVMNQSLMATDWVMIYYDLSMVNSGVMTLYAPIYASAAS